MVQELDFVHRGQPERSTGRFADYIEHALPMAFELLGFQAEKYPQRP